MANVAVRTTNQFITDTTLVRRVDDEIALLEPDVAPLITMLMKLRHTAPTDSPRFEWLEDDYVARWAVVGATTVDAATNSTSLPVTDGTLFVAGDLAVVPNAIGSAVAPEVIRVTVVSNNTLTVVRNVGGNGLATILPGDALRIIGNAYEEFSATPSVKMTSPVMKIGYTQIQRTSMKYSGTAMASRVYGAPGGDWTREQAKKLKEHKQKLNAQLIWGAKSEDLTGGYALSYPIRTSAGIRSIISTNVVDGGGTLSRKKLDTFALSAFRYGSSKKLLVASGKIINAINAWAKSHLRVEKVENTLGLSITRVVTGAGEWALVYDKMLEDGVSGKNGFSGWAMSLDMDNIKYRPLSANGFNRDTHLIEYPMKTTTNDGTVAEFLTEAGFQIGQEKTHALLYNVSDYFE